VRKSEFYRELDAYAQDAIFSAAYSTLIDRQKFWLRLYRLLELGITVSALVGFLVGHYFIAQWLSVPQKGEAALAVATIGSIINSLGGTIFVLYLMRLIRKRTFGI
jgi:hypothetical protein